MKFLMTLSFLMLFTSLSNATSIYGAGNMPCREYTDAVDQMKPYNLMPQRERHNMSNAIKTTAPEGKIEMVENWLTGFLSGVSVSNNVDFNMAEIKNNIVAVCLKKPGIAIYEAAIEVLQK